MPGKNGSPESSHTLLDLLEMLIQGPRVNLLSERRANHSCQALRHGPILISHLSREERMLTTPFVVGCRELSGVLGCVCQRVSLE
jgi:hypothetical protein